MSKPRMHICTWSINPTPTSRVLQGIQLPLPQHCLYPTPPGHCQCCNHILSRSDYVTSMGKCHVLCQMAKVQERRALSCTVISTSRNIQGPGKSWGHTVTENGTGCPRYVCTHLQGWMNKPTVQAQERAWGSLSCAPTATLDFRHQIHPQDPEIPVRTQLCHIPKSYCRWKNSHSRPAVLNLPSSATL